MLIQLAAVDPNRRSHVGREVARQVLDLPELASAERIMAFLSMDDELDTDPLVEMALEAGKKIYAPHTLKKSRRIVPRPVTSLKAVSRGAYGIREPDTEESLDPAQLQAIIVPAVAFDRQGWRLGRGGGFYDRLLSMLPEGGTTCGIGYGFQVVSEVIREPHDVPVQIIVTESEVIRPGL